MLPACRKVDVRLPRTGNSNSHGERPVHIIITMISWIRTSKLPIKNSLSVQVARSVDDPTMKKIFATGMFLLGIKTLHGAR